MGYGGEEAITHPGSGEVGDKVGIRRKRVAADEAAGRVYEGFVVEQGALLQAGGAGSVVDEGGIIGPARLQPLLKKTGVALLILPAQLDDIFEAR